MSSRIQENKKFLTDLFTGKSSRHGIIATPMGCPRPWHDDVITSELPVADWVPWAIERYELAKSYHEEFTDDSVPYVTIATGTEIFASAFGCPSHVFEDSNPAAMPIVSTPEEADALPAPGLDCRPIARIFEYAALIREKVGPDVPISVPDIQSPFDIAALIWRKEDFFVAMYEDPDSVKRLVKKCHTLLTDFLMEFKRQVPNCNLCHCPVAWAPPELGCWLSEDEAGSLTTVMFDEFCLPTLQEMSGNFGGIFMHCCATADHQYGSFRNIPNLRGLNRVYQDPGPKPAIDTFAGHTVLINSWLEEAFYSQMLDFAHPETRFLFNVQAETKDKQKAFFGRMRERIGD